MFNENNLIFIFIGLVVVVVIALIYWLFIYGGMHGVKTRMLVESVTLGSEWQTFTFQPPLKVEKVGQEIQMHLESVKDWVKPGGALILNDGSQVQIDVELVDQNGKNFVLVPLVFGASVGFRLANAEEGAGFAKNRQFVELRLRSNRPILAKNINWYCWTGK